MKSKLLFSLIAVYIIGWVASIAILFPLNVSDMNNIEDVFKDIKYEKILDTQLSSNSYVCLVKMSSNQYDIIFFRHLPVMNRYQMFDAYTIAKGNIFKAQSFTHEFTISHNEQELILKSVPNFLGISGMAVLTHTIIVLSFIISGIRVISKK